MKYWMLVIALFLVAFNCKSQTTEEWLNQKETQRKYLLKQIAALEMYIGYLKKGYAIASNGLKTIREIKKGDFNLHHEYLGSLAAINPAIKKYSKVAAIIALHTRIAKQANQMLYQLKNYTQFTAEELFYCKNVFSNLLGECLKAIDGLVILLTASKLEMKDNERIQRINQIYVDMQEKASFSSSFCKNINLLSVQRLSEQLQIDYSKRINGVK